MTTTLFHKTQACDFAPSGHGSLDHGAICGKPGVCHLWLAGKFLWPFTATTAMMSSCYNQDQT